MLMVSCSEDKKPQSTVVAPKKLSVMEPFRYHKLIEVSPGQDYDVLSWGRGSKATGAFEILHSDSAAAKFTTTTGDLTGEIVDTYNSDMDLDGNPEILIQVKGADTVNYTSIYAFEFNNSGAHKLDFPKLTKLQRAGYRGNDSFYIKEGKLVREFPIYDGNTPAAKPTGAKRQFEYGLRNNEFTIKQLSKDSVSVKPAGQKVDKGAVAKSASEQNALSPKKSKKHKEESHRRKKRRRHRSEE